MIQCQRRDVATGAGDIIAYSLGRYLWRCAVNAMLKIAALRTNNSTLARCI
jgi:hypothetical protein